MSKNTVKYEYTEGCPNDTIGILSLQSYKDKKGKLNSATHAKLEVQHDARDIFLRAVRYNVVRDNSGKIVERRDVKAKGNEELIH